MKWTDTGKDNEGDVLPKQIELNLRPRGITLPAPTASWELKSHVAQMLPKFHDHIGEDPHKHVQNFEMVMTSQRVEGIMEEYICLFVPLHSGG